MLTTNLDEPELKYSHANSHGCERSFVIYTMSVDVTAGMEEDS